jgi:ubiquinone/menaquinone biosynthesis C-methylase UbiE
MTKAEQYQYKIGDDLFVKRFETNGSVSFYMNGQKLSLSEWNREVNLRQPMANLDGHPNPLIRYKEAHRRRKILSLLRLTGNDVVVDVGSERGYLASQIASNCRHIYCLDIDGNMLARAGQSISSANVTLIQSDVRAIALSDNSVDVVVAAEILEHIPDPRIGLSELARIVRPTGRIYVTAPNEPLVLFLKKALSRLYLKRLYQQGLSEQLAIGHLKVFSKSYLAQICRDIVEVESLGYIRPFFLNLFAELRPLKPSDE